MQKRVITGVKPTGIVHIGNYFGAIKPTIELSEQNDTMLFIADYHALNFVQNKETLKENSIKLAATYLACGLNPDKVIFFRQSDIPEVFELNWILANITPKGLMNRAHAYKAKVEENEKNGNEKDDNINMGLYNYPILMAADILLYKINLVPVGADQKQHVEIARDIAKSFNAVFGEIFTIPEPQIDQNVGTIVGLDGRKMSKSYNNTIPLFCDEKTLQKSVNQIVTDCLMPGEPKNPDCTLAKIYSLFATKEKSQDFRNRLSQGLGWGDAKKELFALMNQQILPMREKYNYYLAHPEEIHDILSRGATQAREIAQKTLSKVRKSIGV